MDHDINGSDDFVAKVNVHGFQTIFEKRCFLFLCEDDSRVQMDGDLEFVCQSSDYNH